MAGSELEPNGLTFFVILLSISSCRYLLLARVSDLSIGAKTKK